MVILFIRSYSLASKPYLFSASEAGRSM